MNNCENMTLPLRYALTTVLCVLPLLASAGDTERDSISAGIEAIMQQYPKATLLDIYKSAFQDRYGPGHIISDTDRAKKYLAWELEQPAMHDNPPYEPTLGEGAFVRVNLSVIRDGTVPYEVYVDAFLRGANSAAMPPIEQWAQQWQGILQTVRKLYPDLPNLEADAMAIQGRLDQGIYQGEHSPAYREAYDPHYRIISREEFEKAILPLLQGN